MSATDLDGWGTDAACLGADDVEFHGPLTDRDATAAATALCGRCPVTRPCELFGHLEDGRAGTYASGIYGGLTHLERATVRHTDDEAAAAYATGRDEAAHDEEATA